MRLLKLDRIKDYLLMEEEFIQNQERLKPQEEKNAEERMKVRIASQDGAPKASFFWILFLSFAATRKLS